jgi:hypothetical protein
MISARIWLCGGLLLLLLAPLGCGKRTAFVTGKVTTRQGQPLTSGAVTFHGADGRSDSGNIDSEGNYSVAQAPIGTVKVTVDTGPPRTRVPPTIKGPGGKPTAHPGEKGDKAAPVKRVVIQDKYKDPNQSGLSYTVTGGKQTINIEVD